jgi:hypothetical protein
MFQVPIKDFASKSNRDSEFARRERFVSLRELRAPERP